MARVFRDMTVCHDFLAGQAAGSILEGQLGSEGAWDLAEAVAATNRVTQACEEQAAGLQEEVDALQAEMQAPWAFWVAQKVGAGHADRIMS